MPFFVPSIGLSEENLDCARACGVDLLHILQINAAKFSEECGIRFAGIIRMHAQHARSRTNKSFQITARGTFADEIFCDVSGAFYMVTGMYDSLLKSYAQEFADWVRLHGDGPFEQAEMIARLVATGRDVVAYVWPQQSDASELQRGKILQLH